MTIPARMNRSRGTDAAQHLDRATRQHRGLRLLSIAEREQHRGLQCEQDAERGGQLRERRGSLQRSEGQNSIATPTAMRNTNVITSAGAVGTSSSEDAGPQRPERVTRQHGDRPGRQVDDAGAAVEEHDAESDARDQRARAQPEEREEQNLIQVHLEP